ncbi:thylakoid lumenal 19 kDa protein, chloroplastic-like [Nicotiana tabacum]|uniref:Thylakoid lumenal 19 kDa protein, chloroplastic-like n=2 Tax=Nicotiana TaxID=4085 RepID=A0A1S4CEA3_TOBAC|nr:PREDICTED: thylakoid lumenal 19 kDa protein, chloroplastic [Nicotiana sylvestris]XP_016499294.1 PREDICTED: thylakoid lumenal 19 kDa protein, chloroplastic-like [Nicotiana tabacum]
MATILHPSSFLSSSSSSTTTTTTKPPPFSRPHANLSPPSKPLLIKLTTTLTATALATTILTTASPSLADSPTTYHIYYGTAASAANYGGYGGNSDKKASAEYIYDVPDGWKERLVSKVEKGTNGTDSEFYNPKKKTEKEYLTYLAGFRQLAPKDAVLNNLALSDVNLQDIIANADSVTTEERKDENGQLYYDYEIDGVTAHSLITVTCAKNKLYAHFVNAPAPEWKKDQDTLRHIHQSFKTVG